MAQAPATPKGHRLRLLLRATLAGAQAASHARAPSEAAALELRGQRASRPTDPTVTFLVPLVGKHHVGEWATVEARLAATLEGFLHQTSGAWRCLICGQDRPSNLPDDTRIQFLPFSDAVEGNDKWDKLRQLTAALPDHAPDGYAMPFDADDLLHEGAVAHMTSAKAPGGYLVTRGLVQNLGTGALAIAQPQSLMQPGQKAFWKLCGSAAAFRWDGTDRALHFLSEATQHEHRMFPYLARLAGRPLQPLPFVAALYALNHGENFGPRRGRTAFKARFVERFKLPADQAEALLRGFPSAAP